MTIISENISIKFFPRKSVQIHIWIIFLADLIFAPGNPKLGKKLSRFLLHALLHLVHVNQFFVPSKIWTVIGDGFGFVPIVSFLLCRSLRPLDDELSFLRMGRRV